MSEEQLRTVEECRKIAAGILGVDETKLVQVGDGAAYGFRVPGDYSIRDIAIDPRTGKEICLLCQ